MTARKQGQPSPFYDRKRKAERRGRWAELWVAFILLLSGYRLKARRYRCPFGEIDLIARKNNTIHFIEVKFRSNNDDLISAIPSWASRKRLYHAAQHFMMRMENSDRFQQDFRIVIVTKTLRLHWFDTIFSDFD